MKKSEIFSREDVAQNFLQNYLSETLVKRLDLSTIRLENESFISNELKSSQADLLFRVKTIDEKIVFIYILLEHKSYIDRWVMLQLLGYIVKICERQREINKLMRQEIRKQNKLDDKPEFEGIETEYLEPVIPIIIYHGKEWFKKQVVHTFKEKGKKIMNYWIEKGEKRGREIGKEIGILEEALRMLMEALTTKFNNVSSTIENILQDIKDRNILSNLHREAILSKNLNEFQLRLEACQKSL